MQYIREQVPIREVVDLLGLKRKGNKIHCWRPGHKHHDANASMGIWRNKVKCFVCDAKPMSNLDLVAAKLDVPLVEAAEWIAANFSVPVSGNYKGGKTPAINRKYWKTYKSLPEWFRPYVEALLIEPLMWKLSDKAKVVAFYLTLLIVNEIFTTGKYEVVLCNKDLQKHLNKSRISVIRALRELESAKIIDKHRTKGDCNTYSLKKLNRFWVENLIRSGGSQRAKKFMNAGSGSQGPIKLTRRGPGSQEIT